MAKRSQSSTTKHSSKAPPQTAWWADSWWPYFWIVLLCILIYGKTLQFALVDFDDIPLAFVSQMTSNLGELIFPNAGQSYGFYRPAYFFLLYCTDALFASNQMLGLHLLSLVLHCTAGCVMYLLLTELGWKRELSLTLTCLVMAHPLLTMAVAWSPGSNDAALTALACSAWIFLVRYLRSNRTSDLAWHGALTLLMLLTKETALVVPFLFATSLFILAERPTRKTTWVLCGIWIIIEATTIALIARNADITPQQPNALYGVAALLHTWPVLPELLGKMLMPVNLSVYPAFTSLSTTLGCLLSVIFFAGTAVLARRTDVLQWWSFGTAWAVLTLLPPLLASVPTGNGVEYDYLEHRAYLPFLGLLLIIASLWEAFEKSARKKSAQNSEIPPLSLKPYLRYVAIGLLCGCTVMSFLRTEIFREREVFWNYAAQHHPRSKASVYAMLGAQLAQGKQYPEANQYFTLARSLEPKNVLALSGLASVALAQSQIRDAATFIEQAYNVDSTAPDVLVGKAQILRLTQPPLFAEQAQTLAERALRQNPRHTQAYVMLVYVNALRGRVAEVQQNLQTAAQYGEDTTAIRSLAAQYFQSSELSH
jgi:tetratricopeptide (TPR) repeat protein